MAKLHEFIQKDIEQNKSNMARINIFLSKEQYTKLYELKYKYRLSLTNITKVIESNYIVWKAIIDKAQNEQLYKTANRKTSIKIYKQENKKYNTSKFINNLLIMFLDKEDKKIMPPKVYEKCRNQIYNEFEQIQDPFYDYNEYVRKYVWVKKKFEQC